MLNNYFKIAWRNLLNNKVFSLINIAGLAIGISCCVIIYLYVQNELSYDRFNEKCDRIYRVTSEIHEPKKTNHYAPSSSMVAQSLISNFPEISQLTRIEFSKRSISYNDKKFNDTRLAWADSTLFDIFTLPMIEGQPAKALASPYSIVLSESAVKKYFGDEKAIGKTMKLSDTINVMVTGIIKDIPKNSHITFDCVLSRNTLNEISKNNEQWTNQLEKDWFYCSLYSYILLPENQNKKQLETKINNVFKKEMAEITKATGFSMNVVLQPITDIHLRSKLDAEISWVPVSDVIYVYIFSAAAVLILLIACFNFINLSTARSVNRSKEIGLRKVVGAGRWQLVTQFLGESIVYSVLASILSLLLLLVLLPMFNSVLETQIEFRNDVFLIYIFIIISVGILAGLYPAMLMSSFAPIRSLKGIVKHGISDIFFRKGLVIFQFTIAIVLLVGTTLILKQLDFIQNRNLGLDKEHIVSLELKGPDARRADVIIKEIKSRPEFLNATVNNFSYKGIPNITLLPEGAGENELNSCAVFSSDENFIPTYKIQMASGRNFSKDYATDLNEAFIVNEAAVKSFGWKNPQNALGKKIEWGFGKTGKVIGVVKDFNFASLHDDIKPLLIHTYPQWFSLISVRLKSGDIKTSMTNLETLWKNVAPASPFKYTFVDDDFNNLYKSEKNLRNLLSAFSFLSVLVACLGLFGLASFAIKQRFKEIGIRKVLGSSVSAIISLLSKDFLKLVLVSFVIATPLSYYIIYKWLQGFAYKTEIGWVIFMLAGISALFIAFVTVSFQALKAALANPVKSLRNE